MYSFNNCGGCNGDTPPPVPLTGVNIAQSVFGAGGHDGFFVMPQVAFQQIQEIPSLLLDVDAMTTFVTESNLLGLRSCDKLAVRFGDSSPNTKDVGTCGAKRTTHKTETVTIEYMGESDGGEEFEFWNYLCRNRDCLHYSFFKCTENKVYLYGKPSLVSASHKKGETHTDENILMLSLEFIHAPCGGADLQPPVTVGAFMTSNFMQNIA